MRLALGAPGLLLVSSAVSARLAGAGAEEGLEDPAAAARAPRSLGLVVVPDDRTSAAVPVGLWRHGLWVGRFVGRLHRIKRNQPKVSSSLSLFVLSVSFFAVLSLSFFESKERRPYGCVGGHEASLGLVAEGEVGHVDAKIAGFLDRVEHRRTGEADGLLALAPHHLHSSLACGEW